MKIERGVMIFNNEGKAWGVTYDGDGHGEGTAYGWTNPEDAKLYDPRFMENPTHATYNGSQYEAELSNGWLCAIKRTTTVEPLR